MECHRRLRGPEEGREQEDRRVVLLRLVELRAEHRLLLPLAAAVEELRLREDLRRRRL